MIAAQDSAGNLSSMFSDGPVSAVETPMRFALLGNHPNPFNPSTSIAFSLPAELRVSLSIYDIRGRHLRTLVENAVMSPGEHKVVWDGRDLYNRSLPAGVYFYRLGAGARQ